MTAPPLPADPLAAWGDCLACGHAVVILYRHAEGEVYAAEAGGTVLMESECTLCHDRVMTMVAWEYYVELTTPPDPEAGDAGN